MFERYMIFDDLYNRTCPSCGIRAKKRNIRCPECRTWLHPTGKRKYKGERNKEVVEFLQSGFLTLEKVGEKFGITRERARQIYKTETGLKYDKHYAYLREKTKQRKIEEGNRAAFICKGCSKPVLKKNRNHGIFLCSSCREWSNKTQRIIHKWFVCETCNNPYHPLRQGYKGERHFCSRDCWADRNKR